MHSSSMGGHPSLNPTTRSPWARQPRSSVRTTSHPLAWSGARAYHSRPQVPYQRGPLSPGGRQSTTAIGSASGLFARLGALLAVGPAPFLSRSEWGLPQMLGLGQDPLHLLRGVGAQGLAGDVARLGDPEQASHHGLVAGRIHHGH